MSLPIEQKRNFFINQDKFFQNKKIYEKIITDDKNLILEQQPYDTHNIVSIDNFLNDSICYSKNVTCSESFFLNKNQDNFFNHYHLIRNKQQCLIVIGNNLLHIENSIEQTLSNSFSGWCSKILDSDCYVWQVEETNNTFNCFQLEKILTYLKDYNYNEVKILFQITDPIFCIKSRWWDVFRNVKKEKTDNIEILKLHLSYHFLNVEELETEMSKDFDTSFFEDSFLFKIPNSKKSYYLDPNEFFQVYEWSIIKFLDQLYEQYKPFFQNLRIGVWRDFQNFENNFIPITKPKLSFVEFIHNQSTELHHSQDKNFFYKFFTNSHLYKSKKYPNIKKQLNNIFLNNPVILPTPKKYQTLFLQYKNKFETGKNLNITKDYKQKIKSWSEYLIEQLGWHR